MDQNTPTPTISEWDIHIYSFYRPKYKQTCRDFIKLSIQATICTSQKNYEVQSCPGQLQLSVGASFVARELKTAEKMAKNHLAP